MHYYNDGLVSYLRFINDHLTIVTNVVATLSDISANLVQTPASCCGSVKTASTVPITHKFLEKRVCIFAGRAYTTSTIFHGRAKIVE